MGRERRLAYNSAASLLYQITALSCGFIVPRLILSRFGSDVNGLVNSITQFLGIVAFLELGVGAVVQSSLYKPLADKDDAFASKIVASAQNFFQKIARCLLVYVVVLIVIYPFIINSSYNFVYTATLIVAMSVSSFSQYYFGVVDRILLTADQKGYIQYNSQTMTLLLNTIASTVLIKLGAGIQFVKLTTSLIYLLRPLYLRWYVARYYNIDRHVKLDVEPIVQKWNGVAQHVSAVVLDQTDTIVLTLFSTLSDVSIYGVYFLIVHGVKNLLLSMTNGIQALLGELWARQELEKAKKTFLVSEWAIHTAVVLIFGITASLIVPFVRVYTKGINDVNYIVPFFGLLITLANAMHCLRLPYNIMILAGGHYKQTQANYIVASVSNIVISIITVKFWGLVGVAIGTLVAMSYQTVWMAWYDSKNFLNLSLTIFIKHITVDAMCFVTGYVISSLVVFSNISYFSWFVMAIKVGIIWMTIVIVFNIVFYKEFIIKVFLFLLKKYKGNILCKAQY